MANVKKLFKDEKISFPPGILLRRTSQDAEDYTLKLYGRCKVHHKLDKGKYCQYDFFKLELGNCKVCKDDCCKLRRKEQLDEIGSGLFSFGKHRFIVGSSDETVDKINNARLDDIQ